MPNHRAFKDGLYGLYARIGKGLSNPHRLEMLELLAQGERTVESHLVSVYAKLGLRSKSELIRRADELGI